MACLCIVKDFTESDRLKARLNDQVPAIVRNLHEDPTARRTYNFKAIMGKTLALQKTKVAM